MNTKEDELVEELLDDYDSGESNRRDAHEMNMNNKFMLIINLMFFVILVIRYIRIATKGIGYQSQHDYTNKLGTFKYDEVLSISKVDCRLYETEEGCLFSEGSLCTWSDFEDIEQPFNGTCLCEKSIQCRDVMGDDGNVKNQLCHVCEYYEHNVKEGIYLKGG